MKKLNLGCGSQVVEGWINVDYSVGARFTRFPGFNWINKHLNLFNIQWDRGIFIHNLTKTFPWEDNSIDIIYSSHTLEHFSRSEGYYFLSECFRVMRQNGIIRLVVPDLMSLIREYTNGELRADGFIEKLGVLYLPNENLIKNTLSPYIQFPHKCMYDTPTLVSILKEIGFSVESKHPFESEIIDIETIELRIRTINSVIVEGIKV